MATQAKKLTVVGAGPAGLTAAIAARLRGFEVEVLEQAPAFGAVGSGIVLHSNGLRVLDALGVADLPLRYSQTLTLEDPRGRAIGALDYRKLDVPHNHAAVILRPVLIDRLATEAARLGASFRLGHRCTAVPPGDIVIAADGIRSAVRAAAGFRATIRETGTPYVRGVSEFESGDGFRVIWGRDGRTFGICPMPKGTFFFCSESGQTVWSDYPGDAAHAMVPNLGQGANSAMVDSWVIVKLLARGREGEYEARRLARVSRGTSMLRLRNLGARIGAARKSAIRIAAGYDEREDLFFAA